MGVLKMQGLSLTLILFLLVSSVNGQSVTVKPSTEDNADIERSLLISELQFLEAKSAKLDGPLTRALAKAEIADAAWSLDQEWAKKLLREGYELTFPDEAERAKLRNKPVGSPPAIPTAND